MSGYFPFAFFIFLSIFPFSSPMAQSISSIGFSSGQVISSADVNTNFSTVYSAVNNIPRVAAHFLTYTGSTQTVTVPYGVTKMTAELYGGGGGAGGGSKGSNNTCAGGNGGSGAHVKGYFTVSGASSITVNVGAGGNGGVGGDCGTCTTGSSGSGGGNTQLLISATVVLAAGGGISGTGSIGSAACASSCPGNGPEGNPGTPSGSASIKVFLPPSMKGALGGGGPGNLDCTPAGNGDAGNHGLAIIEFF